jgi:hypothetical protein
MTLPHISSHRRSYRGSHRGTHLGRAAAVLLAVLGSGSLAQAQPAFRPYVGVSVGSFSVNADEVEGRSAAAGVLVGTALSRFVDFEFEAQFPTDAFTRSTTGVLVSFAPPGSSREEIERQGAVIRIDRARDVMTSLSAVVVIHPAGDARIKPGLIAGVSNQHVRDRRVYTPVSIPPGVDPMNPAVVQRGESATRNLGGPTIGGNVSIAVNRHLHIVPDFRFDYGSIGDEINDAWRASVRTLWRF